MNLPLLAQIARSLLVARWRQTLVAAAGVTFSIAMFIALLGFMNGLNELLDGLVINRTPHVRLFREIKPSAAQPIDLTAEFRSGHNFVRSVKPAGARAEVRNSVAVIAALKQDPRVLGVAPKVNAPVLFNSGAVDVNGTVSGIDVAAESRLFFFNDYVPTGNPLDLKTVENSIILGTGMAEKLLAKPGDVVQVATARGDRLPLKVVGFFQSGLKDFDRVQSYVSLATAQKLLGKPDGYVTDVQVKLRDLALAPAAAREWARRFETDAEDVQAANAQFETGSFIRSLISYAVGVVLLVVAGFGIFNILNMMIYEKMDTIAILKATGFSGGDVRKIFLGIALAIGFWGGLVGLLLGLGLSVAIHHVPFNTAALPTVKTYPVSFDPRFYLIGIGFALLTTYLAGFFPARKASRVDPVVIIRGK